jgi:hypothetical protein
MLIEPQELEGILQCRHQKYTYEIVTIHGEGTQRESLDVPFIKDHKIFPRPDTSAFPDVSCDDLLHPRKG